MDLKSNFFRNNTTRSTKVISIIAIFAGALLVFFVTNFFSHKLKHNYTKQALSLPILESNQDQQEENKNDHGWKTVKAQSGDTLGSVFKHLGLSQQTLQAVLHDNPYAKQLSGIKPNQQMQFLIKNEVLEKLMLTLNTREFLVVYRENNRYKAKINARAMESHNQYVTATVRGSLFSTAKRMNISYKLIQQMIDVFNWDIDFARDVRAGDQFSIIYNAFYIDDTLVNTGEILAVSYTNRGKVHQAIRHVSATGDYDYYTPQGTSLKKAFSRYPVKFSHISSTFSLSRKHPILHYSRPHKGIDLAAPIGTPIRATGNGRIQIIGTQSGYGNMVKLSHNNMYTSVYGHLLKFQKGLSRGDTVKRGQIIGYVGQTGLATGPHCHYEFHVNQQPRNPTTVELPRASPISARESASFKSKAGTLLASLKLYEEGHLAAGTPTTKKSSATA